METYFLRFVVSPLLEEAKNLKKYVPTINALDEHKEGLTAEEISHLTGRTKELEGNFLKRLQEADFIEKKGEKYFFKKS